jgi:ribosome biogenesis protein Nip4
MKEIHEFVAQFNSSIVLDEKDIVRNRNRYFLLPKNMKQQIAEDFFYAGTYLGTIKGASFFPSFFLLRKIAETKANRIIVDKRTTWLFICGRDIFKKGILKGSNLKKDEYTLVLNESNECLGFGKIMYNLREEANGNKVVVKNILDIGNFLRREKRKTKQKSFKSQKGKDNKICKHTRTQVSL